MVVQACAPWERTALPMPWSAKTALPESTQECENTDLVLAAQSFGPQLTPLLLFLPSPSPSSPPHSRCSKGSSNSASCTPCDKGKFSPNPAPVGASSCTDCESGKYQGATSKSSCSYCSPGFYSNIGATSCTACPTGTANAESGGEQRQQNLA